MVSKPISIDLKSKKAQVPSEVFHSSERIKDIRRNTDNRSTPSKCAWRAKGRGQQPGILLYLKKLQERQSPSAGPVPQRSLDRAAIPNTGTYFCLQFHVFLLQLFSCLGESLPANLLSSLAAATYPSLPDCLDRRRVCPSHPIHCFSRDSLTGDSPLRQHWGTLLGNWASKLLDRYTYLTLNGHWVRDIKNQSKGSDQFQSKLDPA